MINSFALLALSTVSLTSVSLTPSPPPQNFSQAAPLYQVCTDSQDQYYCSQDNLYIEYAHQQFNQKTINQTTASQEFVQKPSPISEPTPTQQIIESHPPTPTPTIQQPAQTEAAEPVETEAISPAMSPTVDQPPIETNTGLNTEVIFSMINQHRNSLGLPAYEKHDQLCAIAQSRAPEINGEISSGTVHAGLRTKDYDYWITENMIHKPTEAEAFAWWMNSSLHRTAIESKKHTHSCGVCVGNTCAQLFTSFIPK